MLPATSMMWSGGRPSQQRGRAAWLPCQQSATWPPMTFSLSTTNKRYGPINRLRPPQSQSSRLQVLALLPGTASSLHTAQLQLQQ